MIWCALGLYCRRRTVNSVCIVLYYSSLVSKLVTINILLLFFTFGYPHHFNCFLPNLVARFRWESLNGGFECRWGMKNPRFFDQYLASSQKWYKIGPLLLCNTNGNSYTIYWIVPFPITLILAKISRSRHYLRLNISKTVRDRYIVTMEY